MADAGPSYRTSHASSGYGDHYDLTYESGYYAQLWQRIERPLLERLLQGLRADGRTTCLDFACGTGRITQVAEQVFDQCWGVDVSESMLEVARRRCTRSTLVHTDITRESMAISVDVITSFRFFVNAEPSLRADALKALASMLAPGGRMLLNVHVNSSSPLGLAYRLRNRFAPNRYASTLGADEFCELARHTGLEVERLHWYGYYPRIGWHLDSLNRRLMGPTEAIFDRLHWLPRSLAQSYILECARR